MKQYINMLCTSWCIFTLYLCLVIRVEGQTGDDACQILQRDSSSRQKRVVIVGDVHGSNEGLRDILYRANITTSADREVELHGWKEYIFIYLFIFKILQAYGRLEATKSQLTSLSKKVSI